MNIDEMIAVMTAHRDGKAVQFRRRGDAGKEWSFVGAPTWNFDKYDYRIEPEPREWWVFVHKDTGAPINVTRTPPGFPVMQGVECIHVREVLP